MAGIRGEPIRGGTRGGQGDFKWSDVTADKDRENYLGHSVFAPAGRWQKNKDINWYNKDKDGDAAEARRLEIKKLKELEADALGVALGFAPVQRPLLPEKEKTEEELELERIEKEQEKLERRARKEGKRRAKEERRGEKEARRLERKGRQRERDDYHTGRDRHRSDASSRSRSRTRSPDRRYNEEARVGSRDRHRHGEGERGNYRRRSPSPERHRMKHDGRRESGREGSDRRDRRRDSPRI